MLLAGSGVQPGAQVSVSHTVCSVAGICPHTEGSVGVQSEKSSGRVAALQSESGNTAPEPSTHLTLLALFPEFAAIAQLTERDCFTMPQPLAGSQSVGIHVPLPPSQAGLGSMLQVGAATAVP